MYDVSNKQREKIVTQTYGLSLAHCKSRIPILKVEEIKARQPLGRYLKHRYNFSCLPLPQVALEVWGQADREAAGGKED